MGEIVTEQLEHVMLAELQQGATLRVVTGEGEGAFIYDFTVEQAGRWPVGQLRETNPAGEVSAEGTFELHGSGIWTDRRQNPVQSQERAFTSYFDALHVGSFMVGGVPGAPAGERLIFDKPGQHITSLTVT